MSKTSNHQKINQLKEWLNFMKAQREKRGISTPEPSEHRYHKFRKR